MAKQQHRAMPWQWETIERKHYHAEFSTILELRARVEALESAASTEVRPTVNARITRDRDETGDYIYGARQLHWYKAP